MKLDTLFPFLRSEFSGRRAKDVVADLTRFHRIQASPGYDEALLRIRELLDELGVQNTTSEFLADGKTETYGWISPPGWTIRSGCLDQLAPSQCRIADYHVVPVSVLGQSGAGDAEGAVVHVGSGDSAACFDGLDLRGAFILSSGRPAAMLKYLRGSGVAGIIIYPDVGRAEPSHDLVQYGGLFPRADEIPWLPMGFSISRRTAEILLRQLSDGEVRVRGQVDAEFIDNPMQILEAVIPGSDPAAGSVLLSAHLCHPAQSANDNASGSGLMVEIARVLHLLSQQGKLANSIRLVWVPEFNGAVPWVDAMAASLEDVTFALNLDMVGQSPELIGEPLRVFRVPNSHPTVHNACFEPLLKRLSEDPEFLAIQGSRRVLHWIVDAPTGGSDHLVFQAPPASIPSAMIGHDDPYWHTSLDTLEKVDPTRLKVVGTLSILLASLPTWGRCESERLVAWLTAYSHRALTEAKELSLRADGEVANRLMKAALTVEEERAKALAALLGSAWSPQEHIELLGSVCQSLRSDPPCSQASFESNEARVRPRRLLHGPVRYASLDDLGEDYQSAFADSLLSHHGAPPQVLANLANGDNDIHDIAARLSLDFGQVFEHEEIVQALAVLERIGYLTVE